MSLTEPDTEVELQKHGQIQGVVKKLYGKVNRAVWVVEIMGLVKGVPNLTYLTGFRVSNGGSDCLLMTCAHGNWHNWSDKVIKARRLIGDDGFIFNVEVVNIKPRWDVCVMKILDWGSNEADCVIFGSGVLDEAENVICIGHARDLVGSCLVGHVAYACTKDVEIQYGSQQTCHKYNSNALANTPAYRMMGHIWNSEYFLLEAQRDEREKRVKVDRRFEMNLQPLLPIIQCCGIIGGVGTSGAPVFNLHGELVGMLVLGSEGYQIGVHVTALKMFLDNLPREAELIKDVESKDVESGSKSSKRIKITQGKG